MTRFLPPTYKYPALHDLDTRSIAAHDTGEHGDVCWCDPDVEIVQCPDGSEALLVVHRDVLLVH